MSRSILIVVVAAAVALSGGIAGNSAYGGSTRIDWTVAGTVAFVQLAFDGSAEAGILVDAVVKGPPGNAQFKVVGVPGDVIFPIPATPHCGSFPEIPYVADDFVAIFADQSMLFATLEEGWVCLGPVPAEFHLIITGGTGRFENATGSLVGIFEGTPIGPPVNPARALLAETGTIQGWIDR